MRSASAATLLLVAAVLTACSDTPTADPTGPTLRPPASAKVGIPTVVVNSRRVDVPPSTACTPSLCTFPQAVAAVPSGGMITFSNNLCSTASSCEIPGGWNLERANESGGVPFSVTINGPTGYTLAITGGATVLRIGGQTSATIRNLTIRDGFQPNAGAYLGGGITNYGALVLENVIVRDNHGQLGGGIHTEGVLEVRNSQVVDNEGVFGGGGIYAVGGRVTLTNTVIRGNRVLDGASSGGGVLADGANILTLLKKSCVSGNDPDDIVSAGTTIGTNCP